MERFFKATYGINFEDFSAAKFVTEFDIPGLIIHDENDKIVPVDSSEAIHENWKNSEFIKTEGLGHSLQSDTINKSIVQFFEK